MYIFTCMYVYAYMVYMYVCICVYIHIYIYMHTYICIHFYIHSNIYIFICIHTYIYMYIYTHIFICIHVYIYTYVPKPDFGVWFTKLVVLCTTMWKCYGGQLLLSAESTQVMWWVLQSHELLYLSKGSTEFSYKSCICHSYNNTFTTLWPYRFGLLVWEDRIPWMIFVTACAITALL